MLNDRRLGDRILFALELALEPSDVKVAEVLCSALELTMTRFGGKLAMDRREIPAEMLEAMDRLAHLRREAAMAPVEMAPVEASGTADAFQGDADH